MTISTIETVTEYTRVRAVLDTRQMPPPAARAALDDARARIEERPDDPGS